MSRLNILYFGPRGLSGGIGGSARLRNMLDVLRKMKAHTQLISYLPERKFRVARQQVNKYLNTTTISVSSIVPRILKIPALLLVLLYGLRYISQCDIVFAHSPGIVYGFPALIVAKLFGKPFFIDFTDSRDPDTPAFMYRYVLRQSRLVFAVSRYLTDVAIKAGSHKVVHAPGFINTDMFQYDASARERLRKELNISSDDIVIGYAGAFSPDEGLTFLIKALKKLSDRRQNLKLVLLGGSNTSGADDIPQLIDTLGLKDRIIIIPPQPYEMMPAYLSMFDIGCSPKIDIELNRAADPIRIYEYMAAGLPVVASAVGETNNTIENGVDGFLTKPGDADDLAEVLEYIIQNRDSLQGLREKAREKVIRGYSQEATLQKLAAHLPEIVKKIR